MITYLLGGAAAAFLVLLVVGGITGRVRITNCCTIADPTRDARTRDLDRAGKPDNTSVAAAVPSRTR